MFVPDEDMNGIWEHNLKMVNEAPETSLIAKNWRNKLPAEGSGTIQKKARLRNSCSGPRTTVGSVGYSRSSNHNIFQVPCTSSNRGAQVVINRTIEQHEKRLNSSRKSR
eukprot:snap_masked-scaffold_13-processed-gene-9.44-mRNA-1 protein AED:1.00 eAED:1.00 QI:0/-1/0/0/-1/1/1/0/108